LPHSTRTETLDPARLTTPGGPPARHGPNLSARLRLSARRALRRVGTAAFFINGARGDGSDDLDTLIGVVAEEVTVATRRR